MAEEKKGHGFMDMIKNGLGFVSQIISSLVMPPIEEGAEMIMRKIDDRLILMEKRILRKMASLLVIWFGGVFLIFALFFFLIEYLGWSKSLAFFSIGIIIFITGLLLKLGEYKDKK